VSVLWERRDSNPQCRKTDDLQSSEQPLLNTPKIRKGEDGSVDISFYDWRYYDDSKLQMYHLHHQVNIHSFPNQPIYLAHLPRLELGTTGLESGMIPFHYRCLFNPFSYGIITYPILSSSCRISIFFNFIQ
jgi:hypothetical protein